MSQRNESIHKSENWTKILRSWASPSRRSDPVASLGGSGPPRVSLFWGDIILWRKQFKIVAKNVLRRCCKRQRKKSIKAFADKSDFLLCNYRPHSIVTIDCISHYLQEAREEMCGSFYPYIDAFVDDRKWEAKTRILGENFYLCTQQYQL